MSGARVAAAVGLVAIAGVAVAAAVTAGGDDESVASASPTSVTGTSAPEPAGEPAGEPTGEPAPTSTEAAPDTTEPAIDLPDRGLHPDLEDIDGWLQSDATSLEELRGQVVAVQFWTFGCSNCKATLPHMQQLYADYHDAGLEIVGIHAPEFSYEAEVDNIVEAAADLGVTWPIALDTQKHTFHAWQEGRTAFWPRIYLLDREGHIRYDHIGEGRYSEIDAAVQALLAESA